MPVTIKIANHEANLIAGNRGCDYPKAILNVIEPAKRIGDMLQSSLDNEFLPVLIADKNGFINAIVEAFNHHHHLVIRPDDIWLAILTQFSSYVNAHAEELRSHFVAHEDQKKLVVTYGTGDRYSLDFADFASKIGDLIEEDIVGPESRRWIKPDFSTTTQHDVVISSIVMMGTLQPYCQDVCEMWCAIPSVTLLGEKADYEIISTRLDKLEQYGDEPSEFRRLLRPILTRFILSFERPDSQEVVNFWRDVCTIKAGSGQTDYNGWISAFCFWGGDGQRQLSSQSYLREQYPKQSSSVLCLDDVYYSGIDSSKTPPGYATLPVTIIDHGLTVESELLSGSVGINCTSSGRKSAGRDGQEGIVGIDTMQPHSAWFVYEKGSEDDGDLDTSGPSDESIAKIGLLVEELNALNGVSDRATE
ncbi:hypothetical protein F4859DRAFT_409756 [Xylaria cf. heliscus]|nr:hypothetical protein F4859DRAFT_409756 [Xylaria cf. heliscus]